MVQGVLKEDGYLLNCNPATGELIEKVLCTTLEEVDIMVETARIAQAEWFENCPLAERISLLKRSTESVADCVEELAAMVTKEMGKPLAEARGEVQEITGLPDYLDVIQSANEDEATTGESDNVIVRDPHGVVVVLAPWNFPVGEICLLVLPALAAGNSVIVKPSEVSPLSGSMIVQALAKFLPPGVLQVAQGDGEIGAALVKSEGVDMVAMTGSSHVGKHILKECSAKLKRVILELGGKDPMIVFSDADLEAAARDAVMFSIMNAGQMCCAIERIYVDASIKDEFEKLVIQEVSKCKVGDGSLPDTTVGPLASKMQRDNVAKQVDAAINAGAKILYQSDLPDIANTDDTSSFYPVTVLSDLQQKMDIQQDETFGPVVSISSFDGSEQQAISLANDSEYGLASYVYTKDLDKAKRVARRIRAGQVGINCYSSANADMKCPWVGHKSSGFGFHSGIEGFKQFSVPKTFVFPAEYPEE